MEPFEYDFMVRAAVATIAVCIAAPACGVWALSRRLVYLTDAMSHGMLAGVAGAAIIGGSLLVGGLIAALAMALFISLLVVRARVPEDGAIGVVGQGLFALGESVRRDRRRGTGGDRHRDTRRDEARTAGDDVRCGARTHRGNARRAY
jgi:ABC-type Mn2+/Zn2+ transport system permease subunit